MKGVRRRVRRRVMDRSQIEIRLRPCSASGLGDSQRGRYHLRHEADGWCWFRPPKWIRWCPPYQTVEMPCRWTKMERRKSSANRTTESNRTVPVTGSEEDVVDGGLEVEHHDSVCQANTTTCSDAGSVNGVGFEDVAHSENQCG